jgi:hypothetical protein
MCVCISFISQSLCTLCHDRSGDKKRRREEVEDSVEKKEDEDEDEEHSVRG